MSAMRHKRLSAQLVAWGWLSLTMILSACGGGAPPRTDNPTRGALPTIISVPLRLRGEVIRVANAARVEILASLQAHTSTVNRIDIAPDSSLLLTIDAEGKAIVWDLMTYGERHRFGGTVIRYGFFSADGTVIAVVRGDHQVSFVAARDGRILETFPAGVGEVTRAAVDPTRTTLAVGGNEGVITLWDMATHRQGTVIMPTAAGNIRALALAPNATRLISIANTYQSTGSDTLFIYSFPEGVSKPEKAGAALRSFPNLSPQNIVFSPDGIRFAVGFLPESTGTPLPNIFPRLRLYDAENGMLVFDLTDPDLFPNRGIAFSPDGRVIAVLGQGDDVFLLDAATGAIIGKLPGHGGAARSAAFNPTGDLFLSTTIRPNVGAYLWQSASFQAGAQDYPRGILAPQNNGFLVGVWSADGTLIALADGSGGVFLLGVPKP